MKNFFLFTVLVSLFYMSMSAQKNIQFFKVDPSEVKPLQEEVQNQSTERWDDVRAIGGSRTPAFPDSYKPLLERSTRIWDEFCLTAKAPTVSGFTYTVVWVDKDNFIMGEGLAFNGKLSYLGQMYCGVRAWQGTTLVEQKLFPAAESFFASYGAPDDFVIAYNSKYQFTDFSIRRVNGLTINQGIELQVNELMVNDSFLVSDASSKDAASWYNSLQPGTYRTSFSYDGKISQQSYFVKCTAKFDTNVQTIVKNSCPGKNNGSVFVSNVTGGTGHYKMVLWKTNALTGKEEGVEDQVFNRDNKKLSFINLGPGNYRVEVQDLIVAAGAWDDFEFQIVEDSLACECQNTFTTVIVKDTMAVKLNFESSFNQQLVNLQEKIDSLLNLNTTAVSEIELKNAEIIAFPNPTVESIHLSLSTFAKDQIKKIEISDLSGKVEASASEDEIANAQINVSQLGSGTYICSIIFDKIRVSVKFEKM